VTLAVILLAGIAALALLLLVVHPADIIRAVRARKGRQAMTTTGTLSFWDAAWPLPNPPASDGFVFYLGGDALHAWTTAEVDGQKARYRLPTWVRSNPPGPGAAADVAAAVARLEALGAPKGTLVAWDMEVAADAAYIRAVYDGLKAAGYLLIVYGSQSTVLGNDNPDGLYWGAQWSGVPHLEPPDVMTQWVSFAGYDENLAEAKLPFWDTAPHVLPPSGPVPGGLSGTPEVTADLAWGLVPHATHYRYQAAHGTPSRPGAVVATAVVEGGHAENVKLGKPGPYVWRVQAGGDPWTPWKQLESA